MTKLVREVALPGAVLLGLGSMLGTGVYATLGLAIPRAGHAWELALVIATLTALCSGLSSARLASRYPVSGGTYVYGHELLRPAFGFAAGWLFLVAKSASAAAAVLACALLVPGEWLVPGVMGPIIVLVLALVANAGLRRGNRLNAVLVGISLLGLVAFVVWARSDFVPLAPPASDDKPPAPREIFLAAALLFVAFTGYGRVATMGEEIRDPARNIPRAVVVTVLVAGLVYALVASAGAGRFVATAAELTGDADIDALTLQAQAQAGEAPAWVRACLACGAVTALLGVAFNLILGLSRVVLAMARRGDLPGGLAHIDARSNNPARAVWVVVGMVVLWSVFGVRFAWEVSAGSVLLYYGVTNLCALRLPDPPPMTRPVAMLGLVSCFHLAFHVPWQALVLVAGILATGFVLRNVIRPEEEPDFDESGS